MSYLMPERFYTLAAVKLIDGQRVPLGHFLELKLAKCNSSLNGAHVARGRSVSCALGRADVQEVELSSARSCGARPVPRGGRVHASSVR